MAKTGNLPFLASFVFVFFFFGKKEVDMSGGHSIAPKTISANAASASP